MICKNKEHIKEEMEDRENGTYKVDCVGSQGFRITPKDYSGLFDSYSGSKPRVNILLYLPHEALDASNSSGLRLACALAERPHFRVGITTHENVEHAENANVILGYFGDSFDEKLDKHYGDNKLVLSGEKQRQQFSRKSIDQVIGLIENQVEGLVA